MNAFLTEGMNEWWLRIGMYESIWVWAFWLISAFILGSCIGSFLNVCIWRIPLGQSISDAPSHCPKCGMLIRWYDNIPLYGYLRLRGRCRNCREKISPRYLLMEIVTGAIFALLLAKVGWTGEPPAKVMLYFPMAMLIITTVMIDWEHRLIPDQTTYPAMVAGVAVSFCFPSVWGMKEWYWSGLFSLGSLAVFGILLSLFALIGRRIAGRDVLGWGDVKYLMATGALLGWAGAFFTLLAGSLAGSAYGVALAIKRKRKLRRVAIPFGPFLAGASLLWMLIGSRLLAWYLNWARSL